MLSHLHILAGAIAGYLKIICAWFHSSRQNLEDWERHNHFSSDICQDQGMFLVFLVFLHQYLQNINPQQAVMCVYKWYLSEGTIQHPYTEIQENKLTEQTENSLTFAGRCKIIFISGDSWKTMFPCWFILEVLKDMKYIKALNLRLSYILWRAIDLSCWSVSSNFLGKPRFALLIK